jgi:MFS family permease
LVGRALLRIPEKKFMIAGALLLALTSIAYLLITPFWPFFAVRAFQGIGFAFFHTASTTLIANISPVGYLGQSLSYFYLSFNVPAALAPSFGMFLINHFSFTLLFLFCTGLFLCSLFITNKFATRKVAPLADSSIEDGFFLSRKALPPSIMVFFNTVGWGALMAFFPLYALSHGVANPGFFFTAYGIVLILGRALGGKILDLYNRESVILPCLTMCIIAMSILAFSKTLPMFILVAIVLGIGNSFLLPVLVAYSLELSGSSRGPVVGTVAAAMDLGVGLGPVISGIILRFTSYAIMFLCLALIGIINLCYFCLLVRKKG